MGKINIEIKIKERALRKMIDIKDKDMKLGFQKEGKGYYENIEML